MLSSIDSAAASTTCVAFSIDSIAAPSSAAARVSRRPSSSATSAARLRLSAVTGSASSAGAGAASLRSASIFSTRNCFCCTAQLQISITVLACRH